MACRLEKAKILALEFLDLAQRQRDSSPILAAHSALGMTLTLSGSWSEGRNNNDKCISLYEFDKHATFKLEYGEDPCVQAYLSNSFCLWNLGYAQQAAQSIAQSIELAQRLEHR